jgi:hypothetical protein
MSNYDTVLLLPSLLLNYKTPDQEPFIVFLVNWCPGLDTHRALSV